MRAMPIDIGSIHFVGIGGIGMSGIAEVMHNLGYDVQGSDIAESYVVEGLRKRKLMEKKVQKKLSWSFTERGHPGFAMRPHFDRLMAALELPAPLHVQGLDLMQDPESDTPFSAEAAVGPKLLAATTQRGLITRIRGDQAGHRQMQVRCPARNQALHRYQLLEYLMLMLFF